MREEEEATRILWGGPGALVARILSRHQKRPLTKLSTKRRIKQKATKVLVGANKKFEKKGRKGEPAFIIKGDILINERCRSQLNSGG